MSRIGSKVFGAILVLAGSGIYVAELWDGVHLGSALPAALVGVGALLTMFGTMGDA